FQNSTGALAENITSQTAPMPLRLLDVATAFTHSDEYFANIIVIPAYQHYLGRGPDPAGLAGWVALLGAGRTDEQLAARFIGAGEYLDHAGGTNRSWVVFMYRDILGRTPSEDEITAWLNVIAGGTSRASVAFGFAASSEREAIVVR